MFTLLCLYIQSKLSGFVTPHVSRLGSQHWEQLPATPIGAEASLHIHESLRIGVLYLFDVIVSEWMCGHVEQQEVLFLRGENSFLHQVFCQTLSDISQLVVQLQGIPGLS